ncbi:MAG: tetratricopeptide repeat protein [Planctomycetes bacterium]|nr:tetratricopeptide repeat protein [Planctomycetota bacterium]
MRKSIYRPTTFSTIFFLTALLRPSPAARGEEIPFGDYQAFSKALAQAESQGGLLVAVLVSSENPAASPTAQELLSDLKNPSVVELLKPFPKLAVACDRYPAVARRYGVERFPALLFLAPGGKAAGAVHGRSSADQLFERAAGILAVAEEAGLIQPRPPSGSTEAAPPPSTQLPQLFTQAKLAWEQGDRLRAAGLFEELLEKSAGLEDSAERPEVLAVAHFYLGEHCRKGGAAAKAEKHYRIALEELDSSGEMPIEKAVRSEVDRAARSGLERYGLKAVLGLAYTLRAQGKVKEAVEHLERACRSQPRALNDQVAFFLGCLHRELGEVKEARRYFEVCRERWPRSSYGLRAARHLETTVPPEPAELPEPDLPE